jgi:hypothetical protein
LIRKAADRFRSEGTRREEESKLDAFKGNPNFRKWADDARRSAEREEAKFGRLNPYLVRAVVTNEPTGEFRSFVHGGDLWVDHSSLGRSHGDVQAPVVIYLERAPQQLYVTAGGAM